MNCPKCGAKLSNNVKFCPKCGNQISVQQTTPGTGNAVMPQAQAARPGQSPRMTPVTVQGNRTQAATQTAATASTPAAQTIWGTQPAQSSHVAQAVPFAPMASNLAAKPAPKKRTFATLRLILLAVAIITIFLPWLSYNGAVSGTSTFSFFDALGEAGYNMSSYSSPALMMFVIMVAGAIAMLVSGLIDAISNKAAKSKWVFFVSALAVVVIVALIFMNCPTGAASYSSYTLASLSFTLPAWTCLICMAIAAATCLAKSR